MAFYETVLIARQDVTSTQVDAIVDMAQEILTTDGGKISRREYWGLRSIAFRIKKNRKGHYVLINYDAPSAAVQEMERRLRLHEDVLRYQTVRTETLPEEASVFLARRDERDRGDRPDRGGDRGPRGGREGRSDYGDRGPRGGRDDSDNDSSATEAN